MTKELTAPQAIKLDIARMKDQFKAALPSHIPVERFIRIIQTAVSTTPALIDANRTTFFSACMAAASDGLLPDGKESAIVTFNVKGVPTASYMPMIGGILKKVRNSGELSSITAQIVYKNDKFSFKIDEDGEKLSHEPNMFEDRGIAIGVYALAKTKDGGVYVEVMTVAEVMAVKKASRGAKYGPWAGDFETQMWKKTALKRLSKRLPMSTDLEHTIRADDHMYSFDEKPEIEEQPQAETPQGLKEKMKNVTPEPTEVIEKTDEEIPI